MGDEDEQSRSITTITISKDTKRSLNGARKGGETWDRFFRRILNTISDSTEK